MAPLYLTGWSRHQPHSELVHQQYGQHHQPLGPQLQDVPGPATSCAGHCPGQAPAHLARQFTVYSVQFTVYSLQCTVYSLQFTVYSLQLTVYSLQSTVYSRQSTVYSLQFTGFSQPGALLQLELVCRQCVEKCIP